MKIRDRYLDWSTVADAPVTHGMNLDDFRAYYEAEYGLEAMNEFDVLVRRADQYGTSSNYNWRDNRAGSGEACLSEDDLYRVYCLGEQPANPDSRQQPDLDVGSNDWMAESLPADASEDDVKRTLEQIPLGAALAEVESVLGTGTDTSRKRGSWRRLQWTFPTCVVICQFDKPQNALCSRELRPNYAAKRN